MNQEDNRVLIRNTVGIMRAKLVDLMNLVLLVALLLTGCQEIASEAENGSTPKTQPSIILNPYVGQVETEVQVLGSQFPPNTYINLYIGETSTEVIPEVQTSGLTDANGNFSSTLIIPSIWPNGEPILVQQLTIVATSLDHSTTASAYFNLLSGGDVTSPTLRIYPASGQPGDTVQIVGSDFEPSSTLVLQIGVPQSGLNEHHLIEVTVNTAGEFEVEIEIPVYWPNTDIPIIEGTLIIGAVDEQVGQTLATDTFDNITLDDESTTEPQPLPPTESMIPSDIPETTQAP